MAASRPHEIAVFGATGYTGSRIVHELVASGRDVVCVGRDRGKLDELATRHRWPVRVESARLSDQSQLESLCAQVVTVVNAAGSFVETCEPVARAAISSRSNYVDISGEQRSIRFAFEDLHGPAVAAGVVVAPSAAFYAALADLLVSMMAAESEHVETIDIAYHITDWTPSGAAYANVLRGMGRPITQFADGFVELPTAARWAIDYGRPLGSLPGFTYPAPEVLTIPRHVNVDQINTVMSAATFKTAIPVRLTPWAMKAIGRALASPAHPIVRRVLVASNGFSVERIHEDPTAFRIIVRVKADEVVRMATLDARGIFDVTAPIAARVAELTLAAGFDKSGTLAPAEIIGDPAGFLSSLADRDVEFAISSDERIA